MKHLTILLLLILASCKSEPKAETKTETKTEMETEDTIDASVYEMWSAFTESHPEFKSDELPESYYFHDNEKDANRLAELILSKKKQAGSALYFMYEEANVALPKIGTKSIVTDFDGKARAIIEIIKVDTIPFHQISKKYAELDMGTTIEPLKKWKKAHWDFFANVMKEGAKKPTEEMLVVCEIFETIWPDYDYN